MVAEVNLGDEQSTFAKHPAAFDDGGLRKPEMLKGGMGPDEVELLGLKRQGLPVIESVRNPAPASPLLGDIFRDITAMQLRAPSAMAYSSTSSVCPGPISRMSLPLI